MLNRNLTVSGIAADLATRLEGRSLQIDATSLARVKVCVLGGRFLLSTGDDVPTNAAITGSPPALLRLFAATSSVPSAGDGALIDNRHTANDRVQISGDAEVANQFRELLKRVRPDFEEELGRWVGMIPAHGIAKAAAGTFAWATRAADTARANIREYLQEESRALVNPTEFHEYLRGVDGVREAADRVEARLQAIERRVGRRV